jgi:pimeloyl-ACP methyl ester carboxylesterase
MRMRSISGVRVLLPLIACVLAGAASGQVATRTSDFFSYDATEKLYYDAELSGKRPLVLLHGLGLAGDSWQAVREKFRPGFDVYAVDLRGFGRSSKPSDSSYSIEDQALRIVAFLESRSLRDAVLVGHSYGGAVALMTVLLLHERHEDGLVGRLVLIDAAAYVPAHPPWFIRIVRTRVLNRLVFTLLPAKARVRFVMTHTYADRKKIDDRLVGTYAAYWKSPGASHALLESTRQLYPKSAGMLKGRIPSIGIPTLLIWGEKDTLTSVAAGRQLAGELPHARIEIIHNCGHVPHEEAPQETLQRLLPFLTVED